MSRGRVFGDRGLAYLADVAFAECEAIQRDQLLEELQTVADQIRRVERILKTLVVRHS